MELRLIPAWAGRVRPLGPSARTLPADPRVGGAGVQMVVACRERLIPAWAGRVGFGCYVHESQAADPRVGGAGIDGLFVADDVSG